jgi:hypothetical protein
VAPIVTVPDDVWVHPAVRVRPSPIAGDGLFVEVDVPAGTPLLRFGGRTVSTSELHELVRRVEAEGGFVDTLAIDDDSHLATTAAIHRHGSAHRSSSSRDVTSSRARS